MRSKLTNTMALLLFTTKYGIEKRQKILNDLKTNETSFSKSKLQSEIAKQQRHLTKLRSLEVMFPIVGWCDFCESYHPEKDMRKVCVSYGVENNSKTCRRLSCSVCLPMALSGEICESCGGYLCWKCSRSKRCLRCLQQKKDD